MTREQYTEFHKEIMAGIDKARPKAATDRDATDDPPPGSEPAKMARIITTVGNGLNAASVPIRNSLPAWTRRFNTPLSCSGGTGLTRVYHLPPAFARTARTRSTGIASMVRPLPVTDTALSIEL